MTRRSLTNTVLWTERNPALQDELLLENDQLQAGNSNSVSGQAASHLPHNDHFPLTAHASVLFLT